MTSKNISSHVNVRHCCQCQGDTEYHCLTCQKNLCPACKIKHSMHLDTKEHDIRLYKYKNIIHRTHEPCKKHLIQDCEMYCDVCALPFCVGCTEHKDHNVRDAMTVYKEHEVTINNINRNTLYTLHVLLAIIKLDFKTCKHKLDPILSEMKRELQKVKDHLDIVSIHEYISNKEIECSLLEMLHKQTASMNKHLSKLKIFDKSKHKSAHKPIQFIRSIKKTRFPHSQMTPVRVQNCLLLPTKEDVQSLIILLNKIQSTKRGKRSLENEHLMRLMSVPEFQKVGTLNNFASCEHISCVTPDRVWISERNKLVLIDVPTGKIRHTIKDVLDGFWSGLHTLNIDCELFYVSNENSIIQLSNDMKTATTVYELKNTSSQIRSVYCSPSTGDLFIGIRGRETGIVAKLTKPHEVTVIIPNDKKHHTMFDDPDYITENDNGDIVVSDYWRGLVVTDHEGNHRFTYTDTPFKSRILPRGICTDTLSNILVCDCYSETVLILDKGGKYLLYIPTEISLGPFSKPCSLSYDWSNHLLWIGSWNNKLSRCRHINRHLTLTDNGDICVEYECESSRCFTISTYSQGEYDPVLSVYRRGMEKLIESPEVSATLADTMKLYFTELFDELYKALMKAITSRALKYHISQEKAMLDVIPMAISKFIALIEENIAVEMMKKEGMEEIIAVDIMECEGKDDVATTVDFKTFINEIESYILIVSENINFQKIKYMLQIKKENDLLENVTEMVREQIGKIEKTLNNENASFLDIRRVAKDIFELVMDVLNILNHSKATTEVPQIKVKE